MSFEEYYRQLKLPDTASPAEIKRAYLQLARELHPDANPGDQRSEEQFKLVNLAYETLRDPERRRQYDMFGPAGLRGTGAAGTGDPSRLCKTMSGGVPGAARCGMRLSPSVAASAPVSTASTPGMARAAAVSIERIRACACGERTTAP